MQPRRCGLVAVDDTTIDYLRGRPYAPQGALWDAAVAYWRTLRSDDDAVFDRQVASMPARCWRC